jgi:hypothetical protein
MCSPSDSIFLVNCAAKKTGEGSSKEAESKEESKDEELPDAE